MAPTLLVLKQNMLGNGMTKCHFHVFRLREKKIWRMLIVNDNQLPTNFICKELKIIQMGDVHTKDPTTLFTS